MENVLPVCSLDPPVTLDEKDIRLARNECIHINEIPMKMLLQIFNEIFKTSGLDEKSAQERKKPLVTQLPKP